MITAPLSWAYSIGINTRNRAFDAGRGVSSIDRPVISVGNLSTGGTGKTPVVQFIVRLLLDMGHCPVIAMRGYGAKPGEKGDEQLEHEESLPGVPIVAQPDRFAGLSALLSSERGRGLDCVVLDDGFQHRRIARDLDIVLIDASRPPDRDALLPAGHLRDPIGSLRRAGLVILTHTERVEADEIDRLRGVVSTHAPGKPVLCARYAWRTIRSFVKTDHGWGEHEKSIDDLRGKSVRVVSGIGNSEAFLGMIRDHGMEIEQHLELADHQSVNAAQIDALTNPSNFSRFAPIVMTRKDWVKARSIDDWPVLSAIYVPDLSMEFDDLDLLSGALQGVMQSH